MTVAWFCACGISYQGFVHESARPHLEAAWRQVHQGPRHGPITHDEWELLRDHEEAVWEDILRACGLRPAACQVLAPLLIGSLRQGWMGVARGA